MLYHVDAPTHRQKRPNGATWATRWSGKIHFFFNTRLTAVPNQLPADIVHLLLEDFLLGLVHSHEHRLQVFRIVNRQSPHDLIVEDVVQVDGHEIPPLLPPRVL